MKVTTQGDFEKSYLAALQTHCSQASGEESMKTAQLLGTKAVSLGLETLELAAIHRQALATLEPASGTSLERAAMTKVTTDFFTATLLPIESTHLTALEAGSDLERLDAELARITRDLEDSNRELKRGIVERKSAEEALRTSGGLSANLMEESQQLYSRVQDMAHKILGANEEERRSLSRLLQDEITQALLGVHVRLLVLRGEVTAHSEKIRKEVDLTQQLVQKVVGTIKGILHDFKTPDEN
jgi:signal transduction histidine kinase